MLAQQITVSRIAHLLAAALIAWQTAFCIDCLTDFLGIVYLDYKHICVACITDYSWTELAHLLAVSLPTHLIALGLIAWLIVAFELIAQLFFF